MSLLRASSTFCLDLVASRVKFSRTRTLSSELWDFGRTSCKILGANCMYREPVYSLCYRQPLLLVPVAINMCNAWNNLQSMIITMAGTMSTININQFQSCPANTECNVVHEYSELMMVRVVPYQLPNKLLHIYIYTRICSVTDHILFILYSTQLSNYEVPSAAFQPFSLPSDFQMKNYRKRSSIVDAARMIRCS